MISGDIRGEIEPCGCSEEGDMGGIKRTSTLIKQKREDSEKFFWLDLGNFSADSSEQGLLKSQMLVKNFDQLKLTAVLPGPREFGRGLLNLNEFILPFVLTNSKLKIKNVSRHIVAENYLIYGYLSKNLLETGTHKTKFLNTLDSFLKDIDKQRVDIGKKKILLFRGDDKELKTILGLSFFDLIIPANQVENEEEQVLEFKLAKTSLVTAPLKGQGLLEISFSKGSSNHNFIWLTDNIVDDSTWLADFKTYKESVDQLFFKFIEQQESSSYKTVYNGATSCIDCHEKEGAIWQKSRHAHAWKTLEKVKRTNDPECIVCHSVGFKKGGFLSADLTPDLKNVQCENCHGITPEHEENDPFTRTRVELTKKTCKQCHIGAHSPSFDFNKYWIKIEH